MYRYLVYYNCLLIILIFSELQSNYANYIAGCTTNSILASSKGFNGAVDFARFKYARSAIAVFDGG